MFWFSSDNIVGVSTSVYFLLLNKFYSAGFQFLFSFIRSVEQSIQVR